MSTETEADAKGLHDPSTVAEKDTLSVTDNRTGRSYELPITDSTVRASDLRQIKVDEGEFGMMSYDPAFM
ncbi:MAG TPA: citrate (Si)-synthase, partial [Solirubrobacteraceae bacterium]